MKFSRRSALAGLASLTVASPLRAEQVDIAKQLREIMVASRSRFDAAMFELNKVAGPELISPLIFAMRFSPNPYPTIVDLLEKITGEKVGDTWHDWMLWQEAHPEFTPHPAYIDMKRDLYLRIDPYFDVFLKPEHLQPDRMKIRFEEMTWGGVRKDGIPSLDNPIQVAADAPEAEYLLDEDLVFGVAVNGDIRAYPLRIMGWHEMFNDVVGGVPLAMAYCTLCGSGILFETQIDGYEEPFSFGSSGFLYRSNKLMYDRGTNSLWNQFTGRPVSGELVDSGIELRQRPIAIAPWGDWKRRNPDTKVITLRTGFSRDYGSGVVYNEYFSSPDLMFPALVNQEKLRQKDYVFGVRTFGGAKAWALKAFEGSAVINDIVADLPIVIIGDAASRTVRAYERGDLSFAADVSDDELSANDQTWKITEEALRGPDGTLKPRVAGHIAYWFAWDGYLGAKSELVGG
ncbi:MAG: DUF3179 domain-containing protein [Pseudomonadota bacterium]